jgi:hypothetical protein
MSPRLVPAPPGWVAVILLVMDLLADLDLPFARGSSAGHSPIE